jgi:trimethylamine--corrinoid protein Co-methyltransferase
VLSEEQVLKIHLATLELLDTVGVQVMHPEAVAMLHGAGCRVTKDNIVQIPNGLVETSIRSAPSSIFIYNRLGQEAMHLEGRNTYFGMGTDLIKTWDLDSGKLRKSCLRDVKNSVKIGDYLPEIDFVASFALPLDSPPNLMNIDAFKAELEHSVKPIYFVAAGLEDLEIINDMAAEAVGGHKRLREKPIHIHYSEPLSPLTHTYSAVSKLFFCRPWHSGELFTGYDVRCHCAGDPGRRHYHGKCRSAQRYRPSSIAWQGFTDNFGFWYVHV